MEQEAVNAPWGKLFTWEEITTLVVCLALDLLDYLVPFMMTPLYGDLLDFMGIIYVLLHFNWLGAISFLEIVPGFDILPLYTITWATWYFNTSKSRKRSTSDELERWR